LNEAKLQVEDEDLTAIGELLKSQINRRRTIPCKLVPSKFSS